MGHREGGTGGIALGALNGDQLGLFVNGPADTFVVEAAVGKQIHLVVADAVFVQRAGGGTDADYFLQGVIGQTHGGKQLVTGQQIGAEGNSQGVGAAGDLRTHQRSLRMKNVCIDFFQVVTAQVIIAVAGGGGEAGGGNLVLLHGREDLGLVVFRNLIDGVETAANLLQGFFAVGINGRGNAHLLI